MPSTLTKFNPTRQHIHVQMLLKSQSGKEVLFNAILDTGAPYTELSARSLAKFGFKEAKTTLPTKAMQETQKYSKIRLAKVTTLGHRLENWVVYISRFHESWGIDALIGLDFFKRFKVTIDYSKGEILTEPF